jgi:hypothetical protein
MLIRRHATDDDGEFTEGAVGMSEKQKQTPQERAKALMDEIDTAGLKRNYSGAEVKTILNTIACMKDAAQLVEDTCRAPISVEKLRRGDVFIAGTYGGKPRPWVVLRVRPEAVDATAMSSGEKAPDLVQSKCRLWPGSWLGSAVASFRMDVATREVTRPYTNLAHLSEIEAAIYGRVAPGRAKSIADIARKIGGRAA